MPNFAGAQFLQPVKSIEGTPFKDFEQLPDGTLKDRGDLTLRQAIRLALNHSHDRSDDDKKLDYFTILNKLFSAGPETNFELTSDEIVLIKNKCKQRWGAEAFGFIHNVLEGKNNDFKVISQEPVHHQV